ncbi:hypothetical protein MKW98_011387 [Papaver atlanticum]|uniref:Uncharacterized protein n=1 Tax=Papaver atlanticum TaxID=357466 RepID=A0AAD4XM84_9MAGN|nr:hypothetical protein MKW98_011387 [Papaver atlanticum]
MDRIEPGGPSCGSRHPDWDLTWTARKVSEQKVRPSDRAESSISSGDSEEGKLQPDWKMGDSSIALNLSTWTYGSPYHRYEQKYGGRQCQRVSN